jgi:2-iminobutanoate/2-iminopropanoate deaminase
MVQAFNPPELWSPFGAFSMAVIQGDGHIVHLKGQICGNSAGEVSAPRFRHALTLTLPAI